MSGAKFATTTGANLRPWIDIVDDGVLLRGVKVGRLEHQPIEIRFAVARLHLDRRRRYPAVSQQLGDVLLCYFHRGLAFIAPDDGYLRLCWRGIRIDEVQAVW